MNKEKQRENITLISVDEKICFMMQKVIVTFVATRKRSHKNRHAEGQKQNRVYQRKNMLYL